MRNFLVLPILVFCLQTKAQTKKHYWSVGVNPMGFVEPISAMGPCFSYHLSPSFEFWSEASYLFGGAVRIENWKRLSGFRFILQARYYPGKRKTFFIAPEFRLKHYTYSSTAPFLNTTTNDTLNNYPFHGSQWLTGGAIVFGNQLVLSRRRQLYLEVTAGVGSKLRRIRRTKVPEGYHYLYPFRKYAFALSYEDDNESEPYIPLGLRLIWKLKQ